MVNERGSVTVWLLGWCVCLLFLGGLSVDLWRVSNARQQLSGIADAAAVLAASALDEPLFRTQGLVALDVSRARQAAQAYLAAHLPTLAQRQVHAQPGRVTVVVTQDVELSLLRLLAPTPRLRIEVSAHVRPQRHP